MLVSKWRARAGCCFHLARDLLEHSNIDFYTCELSPEKLSVLIKHHWCESCSYFASPFQFILFIYVPLPLFDVIRCWWCYLLVILESEVLCLDQYGCIQFPTLLSTLSQFRLVAIFFTLFDGSWPRSHGYTGHTFSVFSSTSTLYTSFFTRPKMSVPLKEQTGPKSHFPFSMELLNHLCQLSCLYLLTNDHLI